MGRYHPKGLAARIAFRARLEAAQGGLCAYCFEPFVPFNGDTHDPLVSSVDHVVPWALGGRNERNKVAVHFRCNVEKGHRKPTGCELIALAWVNARLGLGG